MDIRKILSRKRQRMGAIEAELGTLREEVATLERALEIAEREEGPPREMSSTHAATRDPEGSSSAKVYRSVATGQFRPAGLQSLIETIRAIVQDLPEPFSTLDVKRRLKEVAPELFEKTHHSSISGTMRRMAGKELEVVERGGPGKEATYRRAGLSASTVSTARFHTIRQQLEKEEELGKKIAL